MKNPVGTDATRTILTSDVSSYRVTQLAPGTYSVRIDKAGFKIFQQDNVTLAIDQVAEIDAKLDIGSQQQTVNVTSESPVIQTENSSVGLVVDSETIQNTPLNGHLSILGLLNLVPGVQDVAAQDQVPFRGVTLAFGTNQRNSYGDVGFTFDGLIPHSADVTRFNLRIDHKINDKNQIRGTFLRAFYGPFPDVGTFIPRGTRSRWECTNSTVTVS